MHQTPRSLIITIEKSPMEITTKVFEGTNNTTTTELELETLFNTDTYYQIAGAYSRMVEKELGRTYFFLPWRVKDTVKYNKKIEQIKKLIRIVVDVKTSFEYYMEVQFKQQMPFLKTQKVRHVPFPNMLTDRAKKLFLEHEKRKKEKFIFSDEQLEHRFRRQLDVGGSLQKSMEVLADRLAQIGELSNEIVVDELESLARRARVTNLYVSSHPLRDKSAYLLTVAREASEKLTDAHVLSVRKVRQKLLGNDSVFSQRLRKYL